MAAVKNPKASEMLTMVTLDQLVLRPGFNVRTEEGPEWEKGVAELADSIMAVGLQHPLHCGFRGTALTPKTVHEVIAGHRRYAALQRIAKLHPDKIEPIQIITRKVGKADPIGDLNLMLADMQSAKLTALEAAHGMRKLEELGATEEQVMRALNVKTPAMLDHYRRLLTATPAVLELVEEGKIAGTTVSNLIRDEGPERAEVIALAGMEIAEEAGRNRVSADDIKAIQQDETVRAKAAEAVPDATPTTRRNRRTNAEIAAAGGKRKPSIRPSFAKPPANAPTAAVTAATAAPVTDPRHPYTLAIRNAARHIDNLLSAIFAGHKADAVTELMELARWHRRLHRDTTLMPVSAHIDFREKSADDTDVAVRGAWERMLAKQAAPAAEPAKIKMGEHGNVAAATVDGLPIENYLTSRDPEQLRINAEADAQEAAVVAEAQAKAAAAKPARSRSNPDVAADRAKARATKATPAPKKPAARATGKGAKPTLRGRNRAAI